uniref:PX domain-containing protein n=1 Tax=Xenopus tropicalis TaxID=8364 RepID=A0A803JUG3_XENTR
MQDAAALQSDFTKLENWAANWKMRFNVEKCKVMHFGRNNINASYLLNGSLLGVSLMEKDLGFFVDNKLSNSWQCHSVATKANKVLSCIKKGIDSTDENIILPLYRSLVRPHLEYAVQFWAPVLKKDINELDRVLRCATKLVKGMEDLSYEVYQIVIIRTGSFDENNVFIERRYSDFEKLHRTLLKEFKEEMEDVVFPKKVLIGNFTTDMISKRMLCLKNYLDELYAIKYIRWSKIYIDFFLDPELDEGYSCLRGGQYKKATEIFQQIVCLQEKLIQHCSILIVPPLCALVVCHKDLEDLQKAYEVGIHALTLVEKHPGHKYYIPLLETLISLAYKLGKDFLSLREKFDIGKSRMMKGLEIEMFTLKEVAVRERLH